MADRNFLDGIGGVSWTTVGFGKMSRSAATLNLEEVTAYARLCCR
jgi:hypothetical protein